MDTKKAVIAVLLMAAVTYIPRALPIAIFRRKIKSVYMQSFLHYVPFAVLGALTFPDVFYSTGNILTATAGTIVAIILAYFNKNLMTVAAGAMLAVFFTSLIV